VRLSSVPLRAIAGRLKPHWLGGRVASVRFVVAAAGVMLVAAGLRLYGLGRQSAWADEMMTLLITDPTLTLGQFWQLVLSDTHPPLYYLLLRCWSAVFGQSDVAARLPSAFCGVLTVAAVGAVKPLPATGRLALMVLLAVSPGAIEYAQEARSYALLLLLATIITGACLSFVARPTDDRAAAPGTVTLTASGILASYTHYFGFLLAVAAGTIAFAAARGQPQRNRRAGLALITIITAFIPWVIYHSHYMVDGIRMSAWIADFPLSSTISWFLRLCLGGAVPAAALMLFAGAMLATPGFGRFARHDAAMRVGLSLALLTTASAVVISWHTPILTSRNLIVVLPGLYLVMAALAAYGLARWRAAVLVCCAVQLFLMVQGLGWYYTRQTNEQWRESAAFVLAQPGCVEGPIYVYGEAANYRYLVGKARPRLKLTEIPVPVAPTRIQSSGDCRVVLWAVRLSPAEFEQLLASLPLNRACLAVTAFFWAFVVTRDGGDAALPICDGP
jgi:4-amino-4-deoxy-L-arabinose transferase-like glycosyltransferase